MDLRHRSNESRPPGVTETALRCRVARRATVISLNGIGCEPHPVAQNHPNMNALREIRESLGFTKQEVAHAAAWPLDRLNAIEAADELDDDAEIVLGDLYGIDVLAALDAPDARRSPVAALLRGEGTSLSATTRFVITEAHSVAREVRTLQAMLGVAHASISIDRFRHDSDYGHPRFGTPEALAEHTRKALRIGVGPIISVMDQLCAPLGVLVLATSLLDERVDAFCLASGETGPVVVLNLRGPHVGTAFGRRITLAHELCHLLYDRPKLQAMRRFCAISFGTSPRRMRFDDEDCIERRARAFAAWLLAPRGAMHAAWTTTGDLPIEGRVRHIMETFGIGYHAARAHLASTRRLAVQREIPAVDWSTPPQWERADPPPKLNLTAREAGVAELRAGALLDNLIEAWRAGAIGEQYVRGALRLDIPAWERIRSGLGFPEDRTWPAAGAFAIRA